jgi:16S rRNA (guanine966-N2)-methyltransferase
MANRAETIRADAFKFLQNGVPQARHKQGKRSAEASTGEIGSVSNVIAPYDIIYVAPPQYQEMAARALGMLDSSPLMSRTGLVIVQIHPKERTSVVAVPLTRLVLTDERRYGSTLLMFYAIKEEQS